MLSEYSSSGLSPARLQSISFAFSRREIGRRDSSVLGFDSAANVQDPLDAGRLKVEGSFKKQSVAKGRSPVDHNNILLFFINNYFSFSECGNCQIGIVELWQMTQGD